MRAYARSENQVAAHDEDHCCSKNAEKRSYYYREIEAIAMEDAAEEKIL